MPIEIRELVIKANLTDASPENSSSKILNQNAVSGGEELIKLCVDRVLEILKEKRER